MADDPIVIEAARYLAGMQQELTVLGELLDVARQQRDAALPGPDAGLAALVVRRHEIETRLRELDEPLAPLRTALVAARATEHRLSAALQDTHATARARVAEILDVDRGTLDALVIARGDRQARLEQLDAGGATLAAYRRVLTPDMARAELFDRRG